VSYSDEEQIDAIRRWWQENGKSVIAGLVVAVVGVGGWQGWKAWQENQALAAGATYEELSAALQADDLAAAREDLARLQAEHASNPYATLGSLRIGAELLESGDAGAAVETLTWAVENAAGEATGKLARLRLAQAQFEAGSLDAALATLEPVPEGAYSARFHELRGDLLHAGGDAEAAAAAYEAAMAANPADARRRFIDRKLANLSLPARASS
jgi:predicted negative regulator of RcsB-dependent stress response